jgi:hypothetical protein
VSFVVLVHSTTSARLAQIDPVGGLVTGAAKLRVYERLQKAASDSRKGVPSPWAFAAHTKT